MDLVWTAASTSQHSRLYSQLPKAAADANMRVSDGPPGELLDHFREEDEENVRPSMGNHPRPQALAPPRDQTE